MKYKYVGYEEAEPRNGEKVKYEVTFRADVEFCSALVEHMKGVFGKEFDLYAKGGGSFSIYSRPGINYYGFIMTAKEFGEAYEEGHE